MLPVCGRIVQPRESYEEISSIPQSGEIQENFHFALDGVANTVVVTTGILTPTKTINLTVTQGVRESSIAASVDETLMAKPTLEATVMQDPISISALEAPVVTSVMRQLMIQLAPVILERASASTMVIKSPPSSESVSATIVESGSTSTPARPTPVVNILDGLITQVI